LEDRHPAAVRAPDEDVHEIAAPREREATEKEIVGLKHPASSRWRPRPFGSPLRRRRPPPVRPSTYRLSEEKRLWWVRIEVSPSLL